jgi:hypothetical protein
MWARAVERTEGHARRRRPTVVVFAIDGGAIAVEAGSRWADDACYRLGASLAFYELLGVLFLFGQMRSVMQRDVAHDLPSMHPARC